MKTLRFQLIYYALQLPNLGVTLVPLLIFTGASPGLENSVRPNRSPLEGLELDPFHFGAILRSHTKVFNFHNQVRKAKSFFT